jgi:hypothetical protein
VIEEAGLRAKEIMIVEQGLLCRVQEIVRAGQILVARLIGIGKFELGQD